MTFGISLGIRPGSQRQQPSSQASEAWAQKSNSFQWMVGLRIVKVGVVIVCFSYLHVCVQDCMTENETRREIQCEGPQTDRGALRGFMEVSKRRASAVQKGRALTGSRGVLPSAGDQQLDPC